VPPGVMCACVCACVRAFARACVRLRARVRMCPGARVTCSASYSAAAFVARVPWCSPYPWARQSPHGPLRLRWWWWCARRVGRPPRSARKWRLALALPPRERPPVPPVPPSPSRRSRPLPSRIPRAPGGTSTPLPFRAPPLRRRLAGFGSGLGHIHVNHFGGLGKPQRGHCAVQRAGKRGHAV